MRLFQGLKSSALARGCFACIRLLSSSLFSKAMRLSGVASGFLAGCMSFPNVGAFFELEFQRHGQSANPPIPQLASLEIHIMKSFGVKSRFSGRRGSGFAPFRAFSGRFGKQQTHSCLLHRWAFAHHPQIGERKQHQDLLRVLLQPTVARLDVAELLLDDPKRVFHFGADARLDLLELLGQLVTQALAVEQAPLAGHHGHVPAHFRVLRLNLFALVHPPVARVGKDIALLAVQQRGGLGHVVRIGRCGGDGVHQAGIGIDADVGLVRQCRILRFAQDRYCATSCARRWRAGHAKVPLIAFFGLVHVGVALAALVLGRTRRGNQRGIDYGALAQQQTLAAEFGVDRGQEGCAELVCFQEVAKAQDGALIGHAAHAGIEAGELAVQRHIVQGFFHGRIGQTKELLQQVNAQHGLERKGWAAHAALGCVAAQQPQNLSTWNHQVHLVEELALAGALDGQLESSVGKADLFHVGQCLMQGLHGAYFCRVSLASRPWVNA